MELETGTANAAKLTGAHNSNGDDSVLIFHLEIFKCTRLVDNNNNNTSSERTSTRNLFRATFHSSDIYCISQNMKIVKCIVREMDGWTKRTKERKSAKWTCCNYSSSERKSFPFCVWLKRHFLPVFRHNGEHISFTFCISAEKLLMKDVKKFCIRNSSRNDDDEGDMESGNTSHFLWRKIVILSKSARTAAAAHFFNCEFNRTAATAIAGEYFRLDFVAILCRFVYANRAHDFPFSLV